MSSPDYFAIHESDLEPHDLKTVKGSTRVIRLSGERAVIVGKLKDRTGLAVRFERPCRRGVAVTQFGLTTEAAEALLSLLKQQL